MVQSYKLPPALRKGSIRIKSVSIIVRLYESVSKKRGHRGRCLPSTNKAMDKMVHTLGGRGRRIRNSK